MPTARVTDKHEGICDHGVPFCCPHFVTGEIIEGSPNVFVNDLQVARLNDEIEHNCPHCGTGYISSASGSVFATGIPVARLGDEVTYPAGSGIIVTASENVNTG